MTMKILTRIACSSLLLAMCASCAPAGYYDSNGEYRSYGASDSFRHENNMAGTPDTPHHAYVEQPASTTTVIYTRPGYYDSNGDYVTQSSVPRIAPSMQPPAGLCRVWFPERPARYQPAVESCDGIQGRVPSGAYVIYGG